ncbi:MAG: ABC transporter substrate-binding protein [Sedimentibacter sp.]|uniref:ABC transporter substrate-binding protein n=1 Tax=Sedimentibacter sp. TaxID=1960295 RepID=UPI0029812747|nr:ABC transporter substrate-binding protein [Sedimentibacter sp.]MDW5299972.1 ABC transporter substrate-binding protein [Sedimentibacter sp.]
MKKKIFLVMLILTVIALLTACTQSQAPEQPNETSEDKLSTLPTTDRAGNEITVPKEIKKIISMSPSNTEILIDLGFGDKIIAADTYSADIPGLPENIQFFDMMTPDVEKLIALEPDVIYATGMSMKDGNDPYKPVKNMGICLAYIPSSDSIEGIYEDILFIAESLNVTDKGYELISDMETKIAEIKEIGLTIKEKKTVYFEIAGAPELYSFGKGVFLNEMIEIIGAENLLSNEEKWISVTDEAIVAANPDIILTNVDYIENAVDEIKSRAGWENVTAIKNNDVYYIDKDASSLSNHNIVKALQQMAEAVYPEIYLK